MTLGRRPIDNVNDTHTSQASPYPGSHISSSPNVLRSQAKVCLVLKDGKNAVAFSTLQVLTIEHYVSGVPVYC